MSQNVEFLSGIKIPTVGLHTEQSSYEVLLIALTNGYRVLEIEPILENGNHERIRDAIVNSKIKREDIFIIQNIPKIENKSVLQEVLRILALLNLEYFDMVLITFSVFGHHKDAYKDLVTFQYNGKVRHIGVIDYTLTALEDLVKNYMPLPSVLYLDFDNCINEINLIHFCHINKIVLMTNVFTDNFCGSAHPNFDYLIIAQKHIKTVAQIMVRFHVQSNFVTTIKTNCPDRVISDANIYNFVLTDNEMKMLNKKRLERSKNLKN